jgi:hypothetical protein
MRLLHWALTNCRHHTPGPPPTPLPTSFDKLPNKQSAIGWYQLIKGRWTTEWVRLLETTSPGKGESLATNILTSICRAVLKLWQERCKEQHRDCVVSNTKIREYLRPRIIAIYEQKHKLAQIDQQALTMSPDAVTGISVRSLKDWIARTETFVKQVLKRANQRLKKSNHAITQFFAHQEKDH